MTDKGLSLIVARCFLASVCLMVVSAAPAADQTLVQSVRSTTEAGPTTTEELDFKDVPIYEKDKLRKPPPGTRYIAVLKCSNDSDASKHVSTPSDVQDSLEQKESHQIASASLGTTLPVETAAQVKPEFSNDEEQVVSSTESENFKADTPADSTVDTANSNASDDESVAITDKMVVVTDEEPAEHDQMIKLPGKTTPDALTAVEQPLKTMEGVEEGAKIQDSSTVGVDEIGKIEIVESPFLGNDDESNPIKESKPESDNVNALADSDVKVNPTETNSAGVSAAESLPSNVLAVVDEGKNADVSTNSNSVQAQSQVVLENVDVVASVDLDSVTENSETIVEKIETGEEEENVGTGIISDPVKNFTGYKVYRVTIPTEEAARWILKFEDVPGIEFWSDAKLLLQPRGLFVTSATDILVSPDVADYIEEALKQARLPFEILIKDVQDAINNENPAEPLDADELMSRNGHRLTWERYHSLEDIYSYLDYLKITFPDFVTVTEIGTSTEGRPIKAVRLHQNGGRTNKKSILIDAGIHAREWITPATITYMIREIVDNPQKYDCIMNEFDWLFVPVLNPDGYAYTHSHNRMWRKTRSQTDNIVFRQSAEASLRADRLTRFEDDPILDDAILEKLRTEVASTKASLSCTGADANRNFDHFWLKGGSSRNPCSDTFAGSKAFSEPEARALRDLVLANKDQLAMYISLHAYSQMWLLPWGHKEEKPEDFSDLYSLAKIGSKALETVNGVSYLIGSIPDLLYIASGSSIDWVKGAAGVKYAYTLELRDSGRYGFLLPAKQILPSGKETWVALHATVIELAKRFYSDPASCPEFIVPSF